ncbi:MAG TPA: STELLO glycosyltransferase family protein [Pyrinomonadaceae bacterium]
MDDKTVLVVTSISAPNKALRSLADGCRQHEIDFIVIGDEASPTEFEIAGCHFYGLEEQKALDLDFARKCPTRSYARKNVGYLLAMRTGATTLIETDDDNFPRAEFWQTRRRQQRVRAIINGGWFNIYRYFTDANIWPRGLPLDQVNRTGPPYETLSEQELDCPIQSGLVDENPDVDAIYRLVLPLPQSFRADRRVALRNSWCPFNSQNTTWWRDAFPLLYLPAYCSIRMTDIWRGFVAQRIAWANDWSVLFHEPTAWQERNEHNLMRDFRDEVPGYLNNTALCEALGRLDLKAGAENLNSNLLICYEQMVRMGLVGEGELDLLNAWSQDIEQHRLAPARTDSLVGGAVVL